MISAGAVTALKDREPPPHYTSSGRWRKPPGPWHIDGSPETEPYSALSGTGDSKVRMAGTPATERGLRNQGTAGIPRKGPEHHLKKQW